MTAVPHPECRAPCCLRRMARPKKPLTQPPSRRKVPGATFSEITEDQRGVLPAQYGSPDPERCKAGITLPWKKGDGLYYRCSGKAEGDGYCWRHAAEPPEKRPEREGAGKAEK